MPVEISSKRTWHSIAKQQGKRGSYTKQFAPFLKRSGFVCRSKVQKLINSGKNVLQLRKMFEEEFAESINLIFLKHAGNEKPVRECVGLIGDLSFCPLI